MRLIVLRPCSTGSTKKLLEGRPEDIVRCTDCLTCHTTIQTGRIMGCGTNPKPWRPKGEAKGSYLAKGELSRQLEAV